MHYDSAVRVGVIYVFQDDGVSKNQHQLPVAGKIKKHFNTGPKLNITAAGVSVITVRADLAMPFSL